MKKYYFTGITPDGTDKGFQKVVFHLPENQDLFLIQYTGDDLLAVEFPHVVRVRSQELHDPRPGDCTINPAPDSLCSASPIEHCADTELLSSTAQAKFGD